MFLSNDVKAMFVQLKQMNNSLIKNIVPNVTKKEFGRTSKILKTRFNELLYNIKISFKRYW